MGAFLVFLAKGKCCLDQSARRGRRAVVRAWLCCEAKAVRIEQIGLGLLEKEKSEGLSLCIGPSSRKDSDAVN